MKKTNLLVTSILSLASVSSMASDYTIGVSSATQELTALNQTTSTDDTGIMFDWSRQSVFGLENVGWGAGWNGATKVGNVVSLYLKPKYEISPAINLFGKFGTSISGASTSVSYINGSYSPSLTYGVGLTYKFNKEYGITAQYDQLYSDDNWNMNAISLGVTYSN